MTSLMYERINKQTGAIMTGTWRDVCDFDKRLWTDPEVVELNEFGNTWPTFPTTPVPLATVWAVRTRDHQVRIDRVPIYKLADLKELRI